MTQINYELVNELIEKANDLQGGDCFGSEKLINRLLQQAVNCLADAVNEKSCGPSTDYAGLKIARAANEFLID